MLCLPCFGLDLNYAYAYAYAYTYAAWIWADSLPSSAAYLVSQLPSSSGKRAGFRSDEYYDDDYSLDRDHDSDIYAFEDDDTDYDYQVGGRPQNFAISHLSNYSSTLKKRMDGTTLGPTNDWKRTESEGEGVEGRVGSEGGLSAGIAHLACE